MAMQPLKWASILAAAPAVCALVAAALILPAGLPAAAKSTTTTTHHASASKLNALGHVKFWECPSKTTQMLVAVNTLTLHPGSALNITFVIKNGGTASCNYTAPYASVAPGPTTTTLQAGPCGSVGFEIVGPRGKEVWPGPQLLNCPALGFAELASNATVTGTGTWNQDKPNGSQRVAAGRYTLIVDNKHFSFPLRVSAS
jgi:hypothetical protein